MEVTLDLPVREWYRNSTLNDLKYWGLDYPPLTAYQSYIHGAFFRYCQKLLMRWTVLLSDVLICFPAVFYFAILWHYGMILLNPCLILIDHGHFQYNCISLGFTVAAVSAILSDRDIVGSILFTLALNHKQMSAYFAPAFFGYLFGKCLWCRNPFFEVLKLGLAVLGTFSVLWWSYSLEAPFEVLSGLAPFERVIYEDYVANFWCTTSVIVKWKRLFSTPVLRILSLVSTISTCLPSMTLLIFALIRRNFLFRLLNSALSFYYFSFQVHEKSILLPFLPASFLAIDEPLVFRRLTYFTLLSMFSLLRRDELILFVHCFIRKDTRETRSPFITLKYFVIACSLLHVVYLMVTPPRYPFLFEAVMMLLCFSQFF
ncbi:unnamed protein product [Withania somnifera]